MAKKSIDWKKILIANDDVLTYMDAIIMKYPKLVGFWSYVESRHDQPAFHIISEKYRAKSKSMLSIDILWEKHDQIQWAAKYIEERVDITDADVINVLRLLDTFIEALRGDCHVNTDSWISAALMVLSEYGWVDEDWPAQNGTTYSLFGRDFGTPTRYSQRLRIKKFKRGYWMDQLHNQIMLTPVEWRMLEDSAGAILAHQDGFFTATLYPTKKELMQTWREICQEPT